MSYLLDTYTRYTGFGYGWAVFEPIIVFGGINKLQVVESGCLKASWSPTVIPDVEYFNVYARPDNNDVFHNTYLVGRYPVANSSVKFRTLADGVTLLNSLNMMYVGVRAVDIGGAEDSNTVVLNVRPIVGGVAIFVNDRHISLVL